MLSGFAKPLLTNLSRQMQDRYDNHVAFASRILISERLPGRWSLLFKLLACNYREPCKGVFMEYRYLTTSLEGFVQQLACNILPHGYWCSTCEVLSQTVKTRCLSTRSSLIATVSQSPAAAVQEKVTRPGQPPLPSPRQALVYLCNTWKASILRAGTEQHPRCQKSAGSGRRLLTERKARRVPAKDFQG